MKTIGPKSCTIPLEDLERVEELAFAMLQMDREQVMEEFDDVYEDTLSACQDTVECRALYKGFAVESIQPDAIVLEGDVVLESPELAEVLRRADEVVMYVVTAAGCDELISNPENDMFETMFYNAWGVGFSIAAHAWVKNAISAEAQEGGRFASRGWAPGEGAVEASLQNVLFDAIDPSQIGVTHTVGANMRPIMTVSGFMGISPDAAIQTDGADRIQNH